MIQLLLTCLMLFLTRFSLFPTALGTPQCTQSGVFFLSVMFRVLTQEKAMLALVPLPKEVTHVPAEFKYLEQDWRSNLLTAGSVFMVTELYVCCFFTLLKD